MVLGMGAEVVALQVDGLREAQQIIQVTWLGALRLTEAAQGPVGQWHCVGHKGWRRQHVEAVSNGKASGGGI